MDKLRMQSADGVQDNIKKIGELFPDCVEEALNEKGNPVFKVDGEKLLQNLSDDLLSENEERYQFTWPDKRKAILAANAPINAALRPCREESVDFDNTQNLYIEGDNLDVLKCLKETYLHKVKMIYIDPPYNTGNDFIYEDDFAESTEEYLANSGQFDEQGNRLVANTESNGRFHTDWLNMIYPRLKVARDLLTDDGVIFISIGEHEVDNLKKILCEIFGANNFIENYIWESTFRPDNSSKILRRNAEYVMCVAKNALNIRRFVGEVKEKEGLPSLTKSSMAESILRFPENTVQCYLKDGIYKKGVKDSYELLDDVVVNKGIITNSFRLKGRMIWGQEYLLQEISRGTQIIIKNESFVPYTKKEGDSEMSPTKIIPSHIVGDVLSANAEFSKLFSEKVFSYPKPVTLLKYLINYDDSKDFVVLDFFSGSATTAHAVMQLNAEDEGKRKFILVQLPELIDPQKQTSEKAKKVAQNAVALLDSLRVPHNICEIGKERIRRAGKKIKEEFPLTTQNLDTGFRVLKLDSTNMEDVYYAPSEIQQSGVLNLVDNVKADRKGEDLLFQVMLELGATLDSKIEVMRISGKTVYNVAEKYLVACFDEDVTDEVVEEMAKMKPQYAVLRDTSMKTDSTATNFDQIFKTYSPDTIAKIL